MATNSSRYARKDTLLSRRQIETLIAEGRSIIIKNGKVLKVDAWLPYHPGGDKAIMHMVGRDATDEVHALHSTEALNRMGKFQIGRIEGRWENLIPPIQGGKFRTEEEDITECSVQEVDDQSSSDPESSVDENIFDESDEQRLRRRSTKATNSSSRATSATSLSSNNVSDQRPIDAGLASLDARTQKELDFDLAKYPSLDSATQETIVQKYRLLNERLKAAGLYQCNYTAYMIEIARYTLLFSFFLYFLHRGWYLPSAIALGCFWHQLVFTAHDAGHMGITHSYHVDTVLGIIIADFLGGLSEGWWKRNHNVHHIVTNSPEHDPDIEHMPFFAISHRFFTSLRSSYYDRVMTYDPVAKFMLRFQHYMYYPLLTFGRFNLYVLSWEYILRGLGPRKGPAAWHRWLELAGQIFFWTWFGYFTVYRSIPTGWDRFVFFMVSHMVPMVVHVQITLSHFAMSTSDMGPAESFPQKMLRTTMDVDCPEWLDFFHGGLQFQAVHHLFPRLPRHNLREAQKLVIAFCEEVEIPYALFGFVDGNKEVIGRLGDVARQARILAECQRVMSTQADFGMH
ncbi:MAG: hypothetical protein M1821_006685 [Bathelium mastoideum]|nr:MAG: hypothetical protein M1821_006685 [Bathelium mastoideum]